MKDHVLSCSGNLSKNYTLLDIFNRQLKKFPDKIMLIDEDEVMSSYSEINLLSNDLASTIWSNFEENTSLFVATLLPQGRNFIVTTIATFKLGCTCGPLSIEYPLEKINFMLADMGNPLLISTSDILKGLHLDYAHVICLDKQQDVSSENQVLYPVTNTNTMAYVFYTSGSTGKAKAVTIDHSPLILDIYWCKEKFQLDEDSKSILFLNPAFSFTTEEIWPCVAAGGILMVPPSHLKYDLPLLRTWINRVGVSLLTLPAPLAEKFYTLPLENKQNSLNWLNCGSGMLSLGIPHGLPYAISYCYGSTEALRITENTLCTPSAEGQMESLVVKKIAQTTVGKPVSNVEVYILDDNMEEIPQGDIGEVYVGGSHISKGYLNREELTNRMFVQSPFDDTKKLYRTGDFGRWIDDGNLEIKGRVDDQLKINGHRVELGEIRQILVEAIPELKNVLVLPKTSADGETQIHAFLILDKEKGNFSDWSTDKAYSILQKRLPHYALPSSITRLNEFPLNANGKLDRLKLLQMKQEPMKRMRVANVQKTVLEEIVLEAWATVLRLKTDEISVLDNFFALGGNSMLAAKVMATLQEAPHNFNQLRMFHLFASPTVQGLAQMLETTKQTNFSTFADYSSNNLDFPLSFQQEQIWFYMQQTKYEGLYLKISSIKFEDTREDISDLVEKSINLVLTRHPILQVHIFEENGEAKQTLRTTNSNSSLTCIYVPEENLDESTLLSNVEVKKIILDHIQSDLKNLMKFFLVQGRFGVILVIISHHLVIDGIGIRLFHQEVTKAYSSLKNNMTLDLPKFKTNYLDYTLWQRLENDIAEEKADGDFWTTYLKGIRPLELPTDFPRMAHAQHKKTGLKRFFIEPETSRLVKTFAQRNETTLFISLLTAFKSLCFRYVSQEDIFFLIPIDGRGNSQFESLIGHFVNMVVFKSIISGKDTFASLTKKIKSSFASVLKHQNFPLQKVIEKCGMDKNDTGLLRVCVGMEPKLFTESILESTAQYDLAANLGTTIFELFVNFEEMDNGSIRGVIEYDTNLYTETRIDRLVSHFITILANGVAADEIPLEGLSLMSETEQTQLLHDFGNSTNQIQPFQLKNESLLSQFNDQVQKFPNHVAIEDNGILLTFSDLDKKSEKLALRLGSRSIFTAVLLPSDSYYVITILAILKAAKAIVPIDIGQPTKRVLSILEGLNYPLLVTTSEMSDKHSYTACLCIDKFDFDSEDPIECHFHNPSSGPISYVLHTSGSTGVPKPVQDENDGLVNVVKWFQQELGITRDDRQLLYTSPGFDGSITEIWPCLIGGGTLVVPPLRLRYDIDQLRQWIIEQRVTRLNFTSVVAEMFYNVDTKIFATCALRSLVCGGERLHQLPSKYLPFHVLFVYGVTEASVWSTAMELVAYSNQAASNGVIPIGRPITNVQIYVLDKNLCPVPVGIIGEIFIGGFSVSPGYYNRSELNTARFLQNPFLHNQNEKIYRTGDFGYWQEDGNLICTGRIDDQVKIRGFRVELAEIENVLLEFPSVVSAVVVSEKTTNSHQLHAFCTVDTPTAVMPLEDVNPHLRKHLPNYALPVTLTVLPEFPLNSNGKVDKVALLGLKSERRMTERKIIYPETEFESFLLQIWSKVLSIPTDEISVLENFFNLGGNSLLIGKLVNLISTGVELMDLGNFGIATVYANQTIREQANILANRPFNLLK